MPLSKNVLVTGATGFVGSHLAWKLLEEGHSVIALARGGKNATARERVVEVLKDVAWPHERWESCADRLQVVEGDLGLPRLGLSPSDWDNTTQSIDEIWHCAASLAFAEEEREQIFRMNVSGTRELLEVAAHTRSKRFHHVSTAYVAGLKEVSIETELNTGQAFRNAYEASKCEAEALVDETHARGGVVATVYRPSVVIGDGQTGRATHFHGVYAFFRGLYTAAARLRRGLAPGSTVNLSLRVVGNPQTTLNFVPIDYVVNGMLHIGGLPESVGKTYNITNPEATGNSLWLPLLCNAIDVTGVELVEPGAFAAVPPTKLEAMFQKQMAFYYMYLQGEPRFDCTQAQAALQGSGINCPRVNEEFVQRIIAWYLAYLKNN